MALQFTKNLCAVCGNETIAETEVIPSQSLEELLSQGKVSLGNLDVQVCNHCLYASADISKLEFANTRDIVRSDAYRTFALYVRNETEDPKGYLERTYFNKFLSHALIHELNGSLMQAASAYWAAAQLIEAAAIDYECDENNSREDDDYLEVAYQTITRRKQRVQRKSIQLLQQICKTEPSNYDAFTSLLVAVAYAFENEVEPLLNNAKALINEVSTPSFVKQFLSNQAEIIHENLNWTPTEDTY